MGVRQTEPTKEKAVKNRTMVFRRSFMSIRIIYKDKDKDNLFNVRNTGSGYPISRARGSWYKCLTELKKKL